VSCFESEADPAYVDLVANRVAEAVIAANGRLHRAEIGVGSGSRAEASASTWRFLMRGRPPGDHIRAKGTPRQSAPAGADRPRGGSPWRRRAPGGALMDSS